MALELTVTLEKPELRGQLFGPGDAHLRTIREALGVQMFARGETVKITGGAKNVSRAAEVLASLQRQMRHHVAVTPDAVASAIVTAAAEEEAAESVDVVDVYGGQIIRPRSPGQHRYMEALRRHDMVFCVGPDGTGKTYLAVAVAVSLLKRGVAKRLVLARPAVEAGEKLGFLPGDLQAKVNPYLRPLFDSLHDMMDFEQSRRLMANDIIEVVPLAFMRGRTLNDSIVILDEAQNTTAQQMLMFLTRMGHGSKMIITGDDSQIDLPTHVTSGLIDAQRRLKGIKGLVFIHLERQDIVRHQLVQNIVDAYARTSDRPVRRDWGVEEAASEPAPAPAGEGSRGEDVPPAGQEQLE